MHATDWANALINKLSPCVDSRFSPRRYVETRARRMNRWHATASGVGRPQQRNCKQPRSLSARACRITRRVSHAHNPSALLGAVTIGVTSSSLSIYATTPCRSRTPDPSHQIRPRITRCARLPFVSLCEYRTIPSTRNSTGAEKYRGKSVPLRQTCYGTEQSAAVTHAGFVGSHAMSPATRDKASHGCGYRRQNRARCD